MSEPDCLVTYEKTAEDGCYDVVIRARIRSVKTTPNGRVIQLFNKQVPVPFRVEHNGIEFQPKVTVNISKRLTMQQWTDYQWRERYRQSQEALEKSHG